MSKLTIEMRDIWFTIVAEINVYKVDFLVYEQHGIDTEDKVLYVNKETGDITSSPDEAEVYLSGFVKWDGCSNWEFNAQEECMLHFCDRDSLGYISKIMQKCYDITAEYCPKWIGV